MIPLVSLPHDTAAPRTGTASALLRAMFDAWFAHYQRVADMRIGLI